MSLKIENKNDLFKHYKPATLKAFKEFHSKNPHIYKRFKELATQMKNTGRKTYSSKLIINVMRWEHDLKSDAKPFKINDRYQSIYGRMLVYNDPSFEGFFNFRTRKHSETDVTEEDFV